MSPRCCTPSHCYGSVMTTDREQAAEATIYDVARAAGVSPSTVSRTFSRPGRVSAITAERIRQVADTIGYRARQAPRPGAAPSTHVIGLLVADVTNPANFRIVRGAQAAADDAGYVITILDTRESESRERDLLRRCVPLVDGLILAGSRLSDADVRTLAKEVPVVLLNRRIGDLPSIVADLADGVRAAAQHLYGLGHRSISYLAGPDGSWEDTLRWRALRESAHQLGFTERRIGPLPPTLSAGRNSAATVTTDGHRAVVCSNDMMAIGLMVGLHERGVRVPEQVSVVGHDNIFAASLLTPGLTSVALPLTKMGEVAVGHLTATLTGGRGPDVIGGSVPVRLTLRGSTGPA